MKSVLPVRYRDIFSVLSRVRDYRRVISNRDLPMSWKPVRRVWLRKWCIQSNCTQAIKPWPSSRKSRPVPATDLINTSASHTQRAPDNTGPSPSESAPSPCSPSQVPSRSSQWCQKHPWYVLGPHHPTVPKSHPQRFVNSSVRLIIDLLPTLGPLP